MGVVNATPDSLWGGSRYVDASAAADAAARMVEAGADWIDIGAASSRPGVPEVAAEEEWRRLRPVLAAVRRAVACRVSVDTSSGEVGSRAVDAGADTINDVRALQDPLLAAAAAAAGVTVILCATEPMGGAADVVAEVRRQWREALRRAEAAGVRSDRIILDPGFGFGRSRDQSLETVRALPLLRRMGFPVCVGPSRKASSAPRDRPPERRLEGSAALVALACAYGADIVRVHDVDVMADVAAMAAAVGPPRPAGTAAAKGARLAHGRAGFGDRTCGRITLRGIAASGVHGVLESERRGAQPFLVDVDLDLDLRPAGRGDTLAETINYAQAARIVLDVVEGPSCALIERLADEIARRLAEAFPALRSGRVRVHKPEAPVGVPFTDVSVTYPFTGRSEQPRGR